MFNFATNFLNYSVRSKFCKNQIHIIFLTFILYILKFDTNHRKSKYKNRLIQGVLISNHDTVFTRDLYKDARLETVEVRRNIAAKGSSRQKVGELLAIYGK